jgi:hypothetical protein
MQAIADKEDEIAALTPGGTVTRKELEKELKKLTRSAVKAETKWARCLDDLEKSQE